MYIADKSGFLKLWDLTEVFERIQYKEVPAYIDTVENFHPSRMEKVDASSKRADIHAIAET